MMTESAHEPKEVVVPTRSLAFTWLVAGTTAASGSSGAGVGLDMNGQIAIALLIIILIVLSVVALVANTFRKHPMLKVIVRIFSSAAILLTIVLVTAGIIVDKTVKDEMSPQLAFILVLGTIALGISGVIFASLYKSKWVEGPVR
jgi:hypothetical protein